MSRRKNVKRECNICGEITCLTDDHVPPQGCGNCSPISSYKFFDVMAEIKPVSHIRQRGITFRTLCSKCNNEILGGLYDKELIGVSDALATFLVSNTILPRIVELKCKPDMLSRAIIGHVLASKTYYEDRFTHELEMRRFFQNPQIIRPESLKLFIWPYPYGGIELIRDVFIKDLSHSVDSLNGLGSIIKFYPIAYAIGDYNDVHGLVNLFDYTSEDISQEVVIPLNLGALFMTNGVIRPNTWPDRYSDNTILFGTKGTDDSVVAQRYISHSLRNSIQEDLSKQD